MLPAVTHWDDVASPAVEISVERLDWRWPLARSTTAIWNQPCMTSGAVEFGSGYPWSQPRYGSASSPMSSRPSKNPLNGVDDFVTSTGAQYMSGQVELYRK